MGKCVCVCVCVCVCGCYAVCVVYLMLVVTCAECNVYMKVGINTTWCVVCTPLMLAKVIPEVVDCVHKCWCYLVWYGVHDICQI